MKNIIKLISPEVEPIEIEEHLGVEDDTCIACIIFKDKETKTIHTYSLFYIINKLAERILELEAVRE